MARNITVTFSDGTSHVYENAPDDVTPEQVSQRASKEFGREVASLDGGRGKTAPAVAKASPAWGDLPGNILPSAGRFLSGAATAAMHPIDTASGLLDAAAGGLRNLVPAGVRQAIDAVDSEAGRESAVRATERANAVGEFYRNRYGGAQNVRDTIITDPVGVAADLSAVLGVGAGLTGVRGANGVSNALQAASKYTNPMTAVTSAVAPVGRAAGAVAKNALGLTTGVGAENVAQAAKAGYRGDQTFMNNLRGDASMADVLTEAKNGLQAMRADRSAAYRQGIASTAADAKTLDFGRIATALDDALSSLKEPATGKWKIGAAEVSKVKELRRVVGEWQADPRAHTAIGLDALKQRLDALYPDSPMQKQVQRVVTQVRNEVKNTIVDQVPEYAKTMKDYDTALGLEREIERALSLGSKSSQDAALRKIQSLSRNNANTNYGNRLDLARSLEGQGGVSIMPSIAGQAMNSWTPRSLSGQGAGLATLGYATQNPLALALLPLQSPKAVGIGAYGLGATMRGLEGAGITAARAAALGLTLEQLQKLSQQQ